MFNALGKKVRSRKFVITRADNLPYSMYLTKNGLCTYQLERAYKFKTEAEAEVDAEYFRKLYPRFTWKIERE